ncbi:hypothetical protein AVEN_142407-1 [Araneus ventricosus]|uniref:Uncharacterized protein n=1 Tax=Araneus ventricosus TaxID=182803 RepID=A0A4Y2JUC5_ARAVE|nr:hypothetical protein AVEN_142407-1 [Araneus ventricosus]
MSFAKLVSSKRKSENMDKRLKNRVVMNGQEISFEFLPKKYHGSFGTVCVGGEYVSKGNSECILSVFTDDNGFFIRRKRESISEALEVWSSVPVFTCTFPALTVNLDAVMCEKDVCIFNQTGNLKIVLVLQETFQRKDNSISSETREVIPEEFK